jgi:nucleoside-diphosphate-sugar epimerase
MFGSGSVNALTLSSHILSTIPPNIDTKEDPVLTYHSNDIIRATLEGNTKWIGYLSSTGVYGDCNGAWVDESAPMKPENIKTLARAKADNEWTFLHR